MFDSSPAIMCIIISLVAAAVGFFELFSEKLA
jgi:hypothetical protein